MDLTLDDFEYDLPSDLIAQVPLRNRSKSRLMVVSRKKQSIKDKVFEEMTDLLGNNDVLVINETRVIPARLQVVRENGTIRELLLLKQVGNHLWEAMGFGRMKIGEKLKLANGLFIEIRQKIKSEGVIVVDLKMDRHLVFSMLDQIGNTPLPPYIQPVWQEEKYRKIYQTVFAKNNGSVAAPTAGLHFTEALLRKLKNNGVNLTKITLHVGPGTFRKLWFEKVKNNKLHTEKFEITNDNAKMLNKAKIEGKKIVAVGTTTTRCLESAWQNGKIQAGPGETSKFIYPPYKFEAVDKLITNFHLPRSSLLMLVSAFASSPQTKYKYKNFGDSLIGRAYDKAVNLKYRFFSFGDAMLIE